MDPPAAQDSHTACSPTSGIQSPTPEYYARGVEAASTLRKLTQQKLATDGAEQEEIKANLRKGHIVELDQLNKRYDLERANLERNRANAIKDLEQKFTNSEAQVGQRLEELSDANSQELRMLEKMMAVAKEGAEKKSRWNCQLVGPDGTSVHQASLQGASPTGSSEADRSNRPMASGRPEHPPATVPAVATECQAAGEEDLDSVAPNGEGDLHTTLRGDSEPVQNTTQTARSSPAAQMDGMKNDPQDIKRRRQTEGIPAPDRSTKRSRRSNTTSNDQGNAETDSLPTRLRHRLTRRYRFSRAFLSKSLGGNSQNTLCTVGKSDQSRVYEVDQYICWSNTWNPRIPSQPGAAGVVYTVGIPDGSNHHIHNPINRSIKTDPEETKTAVQGPIHTVCKRGVKAYEYVGMYVVEGFEHPLSKAQEAVEISYDTKREWLRGMTTDRVWIKDLLGSAGLKVEESSNFTTFVTNLMNKPDHRPGPAIRFYSGSLTFQRCDDALYAALVEEGRKNGKIHENGKIDVGNSYPTQYRGSRMQAWNGGRYRHGTSDQRDSKGQPSLRVRRRDYWTSDEEYDEDEDEDDEYDDEEDEEDEEDEDEDKDKDDDGEDDQARYGNSCIF